MDETERDESQTANSAVLEKYSQPATILIEQLPSGKMAIDVYGQQIEPICNYRTCIHKFSEHGHRCKCQHALNYATGVSLKIEKSVL